MKLINSFKIVFLTVICLFSLGACTKEKNLFGSEAKGQLMGSWTETPQAANEIRTIYFGADDSFIMHSVNLGTPNYAGTYNGTYRINEDRIIITINDITTQEGNKPPVAIKNAGQYFDKATFKINDNKLIIDFVTYPADGPVPTQLKFLKN